MNPEALLLFGPYFLLPLVIRLFFRRKKSLHKVIPYLITGFTLFIYPIVFTYVKEQNPPPGDYVRCCTMDFAVLICCLIFFLPISLGLQVLFNYLIKDKI